jgi:hypothetical protein
MRNDLAPHMVASLDLLARNAFINSQFVSFAGGATGFNNLQNDDLFAVGNLTRAVKLRCEYQPDIATNPVFCITSPSALYTIKDSASTSEWVSRIQYANPGQLINWEMGSYHDVRFATSPKLTLWNVGEVLAQTTITAAITVGDGAPDPDTTNVDGVWAVGQAGATHGITVASSANFAVGDIVTLHRQRPTANAALATANGVVWNSPYNIDRRIVAIPDATTLCFDKPILTDDYSVVVSGQAYYGWVTKGRPVHCAIFIKGPRSVVAGVIQPPQTYTPPAIDDTQSIFRFAWDAYMKYQPFYTDRCEVHFFSGPVSIGNVITNL